MKVFRRYFNFQPEPGGKTLSAAIHTLGHHVHPAHAPYPDVQHPDSHFFDWAKGRSLNEYQILYVCQGQGLFEANGIPSQLIQAGTVILLYPGVWHRYKPLSDTGWEEYWVGFSGAYPRHLLEQAAFNPQKPIIKIGFNTEFLTTFERLFNVVEVSDESRQLLASFLLLQLLGIVYTSVLTINEQTPRRERIIGDVCRAISDHWASPIDYGQLAGQHNVSYAWLRKAFKDVTDTSPTQFQLQIKLRRAEALIRNTTLTLSEIAVQCGFESVHYFSRMFKQKMGRNPSDLRR